MGDLDKFVGLLRESVELQDQAAACETAQELVELAGEHGCDVSLEEIEKVVGQG